MPGPPQSGMQHVIAFGDQRATVTEVGATLRSYAVAGREVLDGFGADELAPDGRGQVLAPWPNRLAEGRYTFEGVDGTAALNEPGRRDAIHGLVRWLPWQVEDARDDALELACELVPQPAYPWRLRLGLRYALSDDGLVVTARASNTSDRPAPFGIGFHPYLATGGPAVDAAGLEIPARTILVADPSGIPTGRSPVAGTEQDFQAGRPIGDLRLDVAYTDMIRDRDGRWTVRFVVPGRTWIVDLWADDRFPYAMVYSGDVVQPPSRRRKAVAIEPMSCPPNAFRSGEGIVRLAAGESWDGSWGIRANRDH
jgi:aldose 1-epimerase